MPAIRSLGVLRVTRRTDARSRRAARRPWRRLRWAVLLVALAPVLQVLVLRWLDPPTTAFMMARQIDAWQAGEADFRLRYRWADLEAISRHLAIAFVAAEDQRFPVHRGFDFEAIDAALTGNRAGARVRGASTISQQVAKNLFLWSGRSWFRKGLEVGYTVLIEALWPKRRIIEVYANIVELGDGIYGAEAAAGAFFSKSAGQLSAAESARLAAVLPNPKRYSAAAPGPYVAQRQRWIERQMRQLGGPGYLEACCGPFARSDSPDTSADR